MLWRYIPVLSGGHGKTCASNEPLQSCGIRVSRKHIKHSNDAYLSNGGPIVIQAPCYFKCSLGPVVGQIEELVLAASIGWKKRWNIAVFELVHLLIGLAGAGWTLVKFWHVMFYKLTKSLLLYVLFLEC